MVPTTYQRLINEFLLFQYSCFNISVKMRSSRKIYSVLEGAWLALLCVQVSKLQLLCGPRKSPLNIKTMNFVNKLENSVLLMVPTSCQRLINKFLLFQYSCVCISVKIINSGIISYALERAWLSLLCVEVSKLQLICEPRNSFLNIETIEFCLWAWKLRFSRGSNKLPEAH